MLYDYTVYFCVFNLDNVIVISHYIHTVTSLMTLMYITISCMDGLGLINTPGASGDRTFWLTRRGRLGRLARFDWADELHGGLS